MNPIINNEAKIARHVRHFDRNAGKNLVDILKEYSTKSNVDTEKTIWIKYNEMTPTMKKDMRFVGKKTEYYDSAEDFYKFDEIPDNNLVGLHTLSNGLTIYGFIERDKNGYPQFGFYYYDGGRIRLYVPVKGNFCNTDLNCTLGQEKEVIDKANVNDLTKLARKYLLKNRLFASDSNEHLDAIPTDKQTADGMINWYERIDWAKSYIAKYVSFDNETAKDIDFNWDAIKNEVVLHFVEA